MGQKYFLKVDGVRGTSHELGHLGEFEVDQFKHTEGKARVKSSVSVQMELDGSHAFFVDKMVKSQGLKDATLTVETRDRFNRVSTDYKIEMKGLFVIDLRIGSAASNFPQAQDRPSRQMQTVTFSIDKMEVSMTTPRGVTDDWKT